MKLTVVIVSYNVKYYVEQCLESLQRAVRGVDVEIYVVDNHSKDDTVSYISQRFPTVNVIGSSHNLGFARANNLAIRKSQAEYVLLLNPDTVVGEETIKEALHFMDTHNDAGALGVRMLCTDGASAKESRRGLPTPMVAFYKMSGLCERFPASHRFGHYYMGYLPWDEPNKIEVVSGAFCMLRKTALDKVGLLDEDFFMYGEDIDLSYRVMKGGYQNYYIPSTILHYKGESTQKSSFKYVHVFYDAMFIFLKKHYSGMSLLLSIPVKAAIYAKATLALVNMQVEKIRKSLGFGSKKAWEEPRYIFIGRNEVLEGCRKMASSRGLDAIYIIGDENSLPQGHLSASVAGQLDGFMGDQYVVYDVDAYKYGTIFSLFSKSVGKKLKMGFYHPSTGMMITDDEVFKMW